ncbi:MAG: NADH-quinone oxidoreductase subunit N [Pseudohongiella sp.]|nr:MAG: NADH-quinone oxidoreductase subunit N [Pseudohongiella sp.]
MITSFSDLLPITPLLLVTATAIVAMLSVAIKRSHVLCCGIVIVGLLVTAIVTSFMLPYTADQVTPLIVVDKFSLLFTLVITLAALGICVLSFPYLFKLDDDKEEFYLLLAIATVGALIMVSSSHFITVVLGIETLSMSLYGMIAYPIHSKDAAKFPLEASVKYLILSAVASAFMLFGIALVYLQTGSLGFTSLADFAGANTAAGSGFVIIGVLLIASGAAFKLSLAPFHMWTPDVYEGAPTPAAAYLATIGKSAMFVIVLRYFVTANVLQIEPLVLVFSLIAVASIFAGNLLALLQDNLKRILAYSSIAHMGYILIALLALELAPEGVGIEAISFYLIAYMVMTLGTFAMISILSSSEKEFDYLEDYRGFFWRSPWLASFFMAMMLSLAGIPLTIGFIGKFYLFLAGVEAGLWVLLISLVIGSGIGLYYYLRVIYRMLEPVSDAAHKSSLREAGFESISSYGVLAIVLFLLLFFGVYPQPLMSLIASAVVVL